MPSTKNNRTIASILTLLLILFSTTLTLATGEDNYKTDNNFLTNISESTHIESGYKANILINPDVIGAYATESNYKLDLTLNPNGIGSALTENNYKLDLIPQKSFPEQHDISTTNIVTSKTVVGQGYTVDISVTVSNQELNYEAFYLTIYANTTAINTQIITLLSKSFTTITYAWNTSGFAKGNYTISAYAHPVSGETNTADNTLTNGIIKIVTPGDLNADGVVNMVDLSGISARWYPGPPIGPLGYHPNFDINNDGAISILEVSIVSAYWTGPPKGPLDP